MLPPFCFPDATICAGVTLQETLRSRNRMSAMRKSPVYIVFMREGALYYLAIGIVISKQYDNPCFIISIPGSDCSSILLKQSSTSDLWPSQMSRFKAVHISSCHSSMQPCPADWSFHFEMPIAHSSIPTSTSSHYGLQCLMRAKITPTVMQQRIIHTRGAIKPLLCLPLRIQREAVSLSMSSKFVLTPLQPRCACMC